MNSRDFCFWLQGYFELSKGDPNLSGDQVNTIKEHLSLVFKVPGEPPLPMTPASPYPPNIVFPMNTEVTC